MDNEVVQILALVLLLGLLLTMFGVLQSLGAIRRALEARPPTAEATRSPETGEAVPASGPEPVSQAITTTEPSPGATAEPAPADESPLTWARPAESTATTPATERPEPRVEEPAPERGAAAETAGDAAADTGARALYGDQGLASATPRRAAVETTEPERTTPEPEESATQEDPQEQPFERDGRWWFRRGDELLVYEEQSGQWVAAPEPSRAGSVAAPTPGGVPGEDAGLPGEAAPAGEVTTQLETPGSFWKCPSCGAVNGSTATSCRMCFTARP